MNKLADRFKLNYKFTLMMKGASIDICLSADLDYIEARFKELKECYKQLAEKVGQINIASRQGSYEFDIANSLVSYYLFSAVALNSKRECLQRIDVPLTELEIKQREESRAAFEKLMYTGKLSQGK